jgi:hypothetical protein
LASHRESDTLEKKELVCVQGLLREVDTWRVPLNKVVHVGESEREDVVLSSAEKYGKCASSIFGAWSTLLYMCSHSAEARKLM